jgi:hypothetical protein
MSFSNIKQEDIMINLLFLLTNSTFISCEKDEVTELMLIVIFKFDPNQLRLNNLGQPATVAFGCL